ncbi:MAG: NAD-dependent epimerase/dehydratase family protein [Pseudomonadota bacterium]
MRRFLVAGGAGFIGSHLVDRLLRAGHTVRVLDDLSTGTRDNLPGGPTRGLTNGIAFLQGDIRDRSQLRSALADVDGVFWLAARASVAYCSAYPQEATAVNVAQVLSLLDLLRALGRLADVPVIFASSSAVYGDAAPPGVVESYAPDPVSNYGRHKAEAEAHLARAAMSEGARTLSLRFFNVYGPRQSETSAYSGVLALLRARLRDGRPFEIHGDGLQSRDFVHVSDVAGVCHLAMDAMLTDRRSPPISAINICTGRSISLLEAVALAQSRGPFPVVEGAARPDDIRHSSGSNQALREWLGAHDLVPFEDGFLRYLD